MRTSHITAIGAALVLAGTALGATAANAKGGGSGGGVAGDTFVASKLYSAEECPMPSSLDSTTIDITYCALGSFASRPADLKIRIAGHTTRPSGTTQVRQSVTVGLPCGGTATTGRWDVSSSVVVLPVGSPNNLYVESGRLSATC